tara:strand:- start:3282 stop:3497 length:216 start_codon:yes stop_codon:yes gene_type:complete
MEDQDKDNKDANLEEWAHRFGGDHMDEGTAADLAARFMFAMAYYHDRMKLHIMLHPLFYLAGFLTGYFLAQ